MKIAVGTDDLQTIRSGHFGESKYYRIFEVEDGKIKQTSLIENTYMKQDEQNGAHRHGEARKIMQLLSDCQIFLARSMGMHSIPKLAQRGIKPIITKEKSIDKAVQNLIEGRADSFRCYNATSAKFEPCTERLG